MNIKERIQTVLQKLKLLDKAKANQLTDEEWKQIVDSYQKEYQSTLQDDLAADMAAHAATNTPITQEQMDQVQGILDSIVNPGQNATQSGEEKPVVQTTQTPATGTDIVQLAQAVQGLVNTMQNSATEDRPIQTVTTTTTSFTGPADRTKFLFGIENSMFSMTDRWNRIAANPAAAASFGAWDEETEGVSFRKQAVAFSRSAMPICTPMACSMPRNWLPVNLELITKALILPESVTNL